MCPNFFFFTLCGLYKKGKASHGLTPDQFCERMINIFQSMEFLSINIVSSQFIYKRKNEVNRRNEVDPFEKW